MDVVVQADDPLAEDVQALLEVHLRMAQSVSPPGHVHALDVTRLIDPSITFVSARSGQELFGVGALREISSDHGELKSMHTAEAARGKGVGSAIVSHLLNLARSRGYRRVSLETGTMETFADARSLYARFGFEKCEPFAEYTTNDFSICMSRSL